MQKCHSQVGSGSCPGSRAACRQENNWDDFAREAETGSRGSDRGIMAPYKELYSKVFLINLHLLHYQQCWVSAGVFNWYPHTALVFFLPRKVLLCQRSLHIFWLFFSFDFVGRNRLPWNAGTKSKWVWYVGSCVKWWDKLNVWIQGLCGWHKTLKILLDSETSISWTWSNSLGSLA